MTAPALILGLLVSMPTPVRLPAEVDDAYALRTNPAGLGFVPGAELRLLAGRSTREEATSFGVFSAVPLGNVLTLGASVEWNAIGESFADTVFSLGLGRQLGPVALGVAYSHPEGGADWSFGLSWRLARALALSLSTRDIGENLGPRIYDAGLALRLFHERLLLSGRWRFYDGEPVAWDDGRPGLDARLEVEPLDGLFLGAATDAHFRMTFQLSVVLGKMLMGSTVGTGRELSRPEVFLGELALRAEAGPPFIKPSRVAVLELAGTLEPPPSFSLLARRFEYGAYGAVPLMLERLSRAPDLAGLFVRIAPLEIGWGKARELRAGLAKIRERGLRVDCQLGGTSDLELYLASVCTRVVLPPPLLVSMDGVASTALFFGEALDRLGVRVEVERVGRYKGAPEAFTRSGLSPEQRETLNSLVDEFYGGLRDGVAEGRKLAPATVDALVERGTLTATEAVSVGLVDAALYPDEVESWLFSQYGGFVRLSDPADVLPERRPRWDAPPRIAVIPIDAAMTGGDSEGQPFGFMRTIGARSIVGALDAAVNDPGVVAIVLAIDSPGGDALAADLMARAVEKANEKKPVIASFGDVAASGGYYVAAPARAIYAQPTSITGSIGVYGLGLSPETFLGKLGIGVDVVKRGEGAARESLWLDMSDAERAMMRREVAHMYAQFLRVVAKGRRLEVEEVHAVAEGRVFTGREAKRLGLVDELGGLTDALARAKLEAGLGPEVEVELLVLPGDRRGFGAAVRRFVAGETAEPLDLGAMVPPRARAMAGLFVAALRGRTQGPLAVLPAVLEFD